MCFDHLSVVNGKASASRLVAIAEHETVHRRFMDEHCTIWLGYIYHDDSMRYFPALVRVEV